MKLIIFICILTINFLATLQAPHILETYETCSFEIKDKKHPKKTKKYDVPKLISAANHDFKITFTLCEKIVRNVNCSTCLYDIRSNKLVSPENISIERFKVIEATGMQITLLLNDKLKCPAGDNYNIQIKMVSNDLKFPRLYTYDSDPCNIDIEMMKQDYEAPCTFLLKGNGLIDLRKVRRRKLSVPYENGTFELALCGSNDNCGLNVAGCFVKGNDIMAIGDVETQRVSYDSTDNQLKVMASFKEGRDKKKLEIDLKCNFDVPFFENLQYKKPLTQGRRYRFEVESSFGCVKLPTSCLILDNSNRFRYDLTLLAKMGGHIINVRSKTLRLNLCGGVSIGGPEGNTCNTQHSQVCEIQGNSYTNKGSIPSFEIIDNRFIRATIRNGQKCHQNDTYVTIVDVKCSSVDKGPSLISETICTTNLLWETPKGCPKFDISTDSCALTTPLGNIDLSGLRGTDDNITNFSASEQLVYNVCGKTNFNCSSNSDVAICYVNNGVNHVIGYNSPYLTLDNGKLQLKYDGDACKTLNKKSSMTWNVFCSFANAQNATTLIKKDECTFVGEIYSSLGCFSKGYGFVDCRAEDDLNKYDLRPLMSMNRNYEVRDDTNSNVSYFLNVCVPLLNQVGLWQNKDSMVYRRDVSKLHVWDRYTMLGKIARPIVKNGKLQINSILGKMCKPGIDYTSTIFFQCSEKEEKPKLSKINDCNYEFIWNTKHACPELKEDATCLITAGNKNFKVLAKHIRMFNDNENATYSVSLCTNQYEKCTGQDDTCKKSHLIQKTSLIQEDLMIEINFNNSLTCTSNLPLMTANFLIKCDRNEDMNVLKTGDTNNCGASYVVKTKFACENDNRERSEKFYRSTTNENMKVDSVKYNIYNTQDDKQINNTAIMNGIKHFIRDEKKKINEQETVSYATKTEKNNLKNEKPTDENKNSQHENEVLYNEKNINSNIKHDREHTKETNHNNIKDIDLKVIKHEETKDKKINLKNESPKQICDNVNNDNYKFNLKDIKSSEIIMKKSRYIINFDGHFSNCGGLICKNGIEVLHFIEKSPKISYFESSILVRYETLQKCEDSENITQKISGEKHYIDVFLKCNSSSTLAEITEGSCHLTLNYSAPEVCPLFGSSVVSTSTALVALVIVIALIIIGFLLYMKYFSKKCSYTPVRHSQEALITHSKLL